MKLKRICAVLLTALLCVCVSIPAFAADENSRVVSRTVEQYENGAYAVVTVYDDTIARAGTKTGHKDYKYYVSGSLAWTFTVHGSFSYNGSSATCTAASYTCNINKSEWYRVKGEAYPSGSAAVANGTMRRSSDGREVYPKVTLTCTPNGVLA